MLKLVLLFFGALVLASCGGGGDQAGSCFIGTSQCQAGGNGYTGTGPGPGPVQEFSASGVGDRDFLLPQAVDVVRIQGSFQGSSANFIVRVGSDLPVNEIIGTSAFPQAHDGTYVVTGGSQVSISNSNGVAWSITSVAADPAGTSRPFTKEGTGSRVFYLPTRTASYRIRASYAGTGSENFIVRADGSSVVNEIVGRGSSPSGYDAVWTLPAGARVEVREANGVSWRFDEV